MIICMIDIHPATMVYILGESNSSEFSKNRDLKLLLSCYSCNISEQRAFILRHASTMSRFTVVLALNLVLPAE